MDEQIRPAASVRGAAAGADRPDEEGVAAMRQGDAGAEVGDLQHRLRHLVDPDLAVDSEFGPRTDEAVRRFQRERRLAADGIVGPETWRNLVEAGWSLGDRLLWRSRVMLRGDDVLDLQHRLNQLGFDAGPEDGIFGPLVQAAVEEFQRNVALSVDGVAGPETVSALRRLHRAHQAGGVAVRMREREWLRRLVRRGLVGGKIMVDPAHGPADPGALGPSGVTEAEVAWEIGRRLAARLAARGASVVLSRGPDSTPTAAERARLANEQGVDVVLSVGANSQHTPVARGATTFYFGSPQVSSAQGEDLAECVQSAVAAAGWLPDCRTHPMTWTILRDTRMPAVVVQPGFISSPDDEARLRDPASQEELADVLTTALAGFFEGGGRSAPAA